MKRARVHKYPAKEFQQLYGVWSGGRFWPPDGYRRSHLCQQYFAHNGEGFNAMAGVARAVISRPAPRTMQLKHQPIDRPTDRANRLWLSSAWKSMRDGVAGCVSLHSLLCCLEKSSRISPSAKLSQALQAFHSTCFNPQHSSDVAGL